MIPSLTNLWSCCLCVCGRVAAGWCGGAWSRYPWPRMMPQASISAAANNLCIRCVWVAIVAGWCSGVWRGPQPLMLSYYKVQYASMCLLLNPGCLFIATNTDSRGHFTPNLEWAGAGATVGAIKGERTCEGTGAQQWEPPSLPLLVLLLLCCGSIAAACSMHAHLGPRVTY